MWVELPFYEEFIPIGMSYNAKIPMLNLQYLTTLKISRQNEILAS